MHTTTRLRQRNHGLPSYEESRVQTPPPNYEPGADGTNSSAQELEQHYSVVLEQSFNNMRLAAHDPNATHQNSFISTVPEYSEYNTQNINSFPRTNITGDTEDSENPWTDISSTSTFQLETQQDTQPALQTSSPTPSHTTPWTNTANNTHAEFDFTSSSETANRQEPLQELIQTNNQALNSMLLHSPADSSVENDTPPASITSNDDNHHADEPVPEYTEIDASGHSEHDMVVAEDSEEPAPEYSEVAISSDLMTSPSSNPTSASEPAPNYNESISPTQSITPTQTTAAHPNGPAPEYVESTEPPTHPAHPNNVAPPPPPQSPPPPPPEDLLISLDDDPEPAPHRPSELNFLADLIFQPDPEPQSDSLEPQQTEDQSINTAVEASTASTDNLLDLDTEVEQSVIQYPASPPTNSMDYMSLMQATLRAQLQLQQLQSQLAAAAEMNPSLISTLPTEPMVLPPTPPPPPIYNFSPSSSSFNLNQASPRSSISQVSPRTSVAHQSSSPASSQGISNTSYTLSPNNTGIQNQQHPSPSSMLLPTINSPRHNSVTSTSRDPIGTRNDSLQSVVDRTSYSASTLGSSIRPSSIRSGLSPTTSSSTGSHILSTSPPGPLSGLDRSTSTVSSSGSTVTATPSSSGTVRSKLKMKSRKKSVNSVPSKSTELVVQLRNDLNYKYDLNEPITGSLIYKPAINKPIKNISCFLILSQETGKSNYSLCLDSVLLSSDTYPVIGGNANTDTTYSFNFTLKVPELVPFEFRMAQQQRAPPSFKIVEENVSISYKIVALIGHEEDPPDPAFAPVYRSPTATRKSQPIVVVPSYAAAQYDLRDPRQNIVNKIYKAGASITDKGFLKAKLTLGKAELHVVGLQKYIIDNRGVPDQPQKLKLNILFFPDKNIRKVTIPFIHRITVTAQYKTYVSPSNWFETMPDIGAKTMYTPIFDSIVQKSGWARLSNPGLASSSASASSSNSGPSEIFGAAHYISLARLEDMAAELTPSFASLYVIRVYELVISVTFTPTKTVSLTVPITLVRRKTPQSFAPYDPYETIDDRRASAEENQRQLEQRQTNT